MLAKRKFTVENKSKVFLDILGCRISPSKEVRSKGEGLKFLVDLEK